jgi:hypothetical protein
MRVHFQVFGLLVISFLSGAPVLAAPASNDVGIVHVDITPAHRIQSFTTIGAIGSTVDKEPAGTIPSLYSPANVRAINDAGLGWLSYRLFTELTDEDWHWNPAGSFSAGDHGYWTSSASTANKPIADSFGYRLPLRGNSSDQGAGEDYSRLVDGDLHTYWKSDPYLTNAFTGDPDSAHPQWIVVDLGAKRAVNAMRVVWAQPYATSYVVEHWTGPDPINDPANGRWIGFATGRFEHGDGSAKMLRLGPAPVAARFVRLVMTASSNTCDTHGSGDRRNCVGYAVAEISIGQLDAHGAFHDYVRHVRCTAPKYEANTCGAHQTPTYTSSLDPWHAAVNRVRNQEQPGLDLIARSGLTRGVPAIYPVPMLYSTPANAAAEVRYLEARGYKIAGIELGEEPDGQYTLPEDYAALYVQWARAIHAVDPTLKLGGPVFSGVNSELQTWPDAKGNVSWLNRFLAYLSAHGRSSVLAFMSFEHYPFDGCEHGAKLTHDLLTEPSIVKTVVDAWHNDGLPKTTPLYITEANISAVNFTQTTMQIEGALWLADYMGSALDNGVQRVVYYQDEPVPLTQNSECPKDWGNLTMFVADGHAAIHARTAQFFGAQMIDQQWLAPGDGSHELYPASTNITRGGLPLVTAYAVKRPESMWPDSTWSIMLVNKDSVAHDVAVQFEDAPGPTTSFTGDVTRITFGIAQYVWRSRGAASRPEPNDPPAVSTLHGGAKATYRIPALSITVLRGRPAIVALIDRAGRP